MSKPSQRTSKIQLILCPQCEHTLPGDARVCPNCGIDLALLSLLGEKAYLDGSPIYAPMDTTPQWLVPRIGDFLLKQGEITDEQLNIALTRQKEATESGEHVLLGQTLIELGYLERETLDRAITQQIVELHAALQESNRTLKQRVTERTKELRHALERLTEINQIKANLISNISHELRTPLAHIKGYVELFVAGQLGDLSNEQSEAMQVTLRATNRLGSLIEDLIEFSTASREGITLHLQPVSIPELIDGVFDRSSEKAKKAGVALEPKLEENLPDLQVDPERLSWAIFQLVDNGIKFTPDGGKVNIQVGIKDLGIHFIVSDTGIGIPEDRIHEIFEPFHQLDGSPTRRYGGAGLGLALVKIIVDAHGAELSVESQEGQGTKFEFTIPSASGNK
ncbi:MAG: hypothetical protein KAJ55_00815 [Anaerolineales bacterium]|nr:hypothetical protein [Anaerolineales bacterium]